MLAGRAVVLIERDTRRRRHIKQRCAGSTALGTHGLTTARREQRGSYETCDFSPSGHHAVSV